MTDAHEEALDSRTGWLIVALGVCLLFVTWGMIFTFTVYAGRLGAAFDLSSVRVSSIFSVTSAAFFVAGGTFAVISARFPLRPVVAAIGLVFAVAVGAFQTVSSYPGLVVVFGSIGAAGGTTFIVVMSLVPQWFDDYEGRAVGITMTGSGLGILGLPFVWLWLFARTDIRGAFAVVGGSAVVALLLAALVYRRPPGTSSAVSPPVSPSWLHTMLTDVQFLCSISGYALLWSWYFVLSANLVDILTTSGIDGRVATTAFGTIGGISVVTRVASGVVADRIGSRVTLAAGVVLAALGLGLLVVTDTRLLLYVTLVVFGIGLGAVASLFSPVIIRKFGPANATAIVGAFTIAEGSTAFLMPIGVNVLVESTGGYTVPLLALVCVTLVGVGLFYWGTDPTRKMART